MATITIRNLPDETKKRLQMRASQKGLSLEEEVRTVLNKSANFKKGGGVGTAINTMFAEIGGGEVELRPRNAARPPLDTSEW